MPNATLAPPADDVDRAFEAALAHDAHVSPPAIPGPPRRPPEPDPAAPHGRDTDGNPLAPYGHKADGTPRIKPAGPGRGRGADAPRLTDKPPAAAAAGKPPAAAAEAPDFTGDLTALGMSVWMGASCLRGGKLLILPVPDTRPYAYVLKQNIPQLAAAWNAAAQQNSAVRGYVQRFTGDGSKAWILGVAITGAAFLGGCMELGRKENAGGRKAAAAANDAELQLFMAEAMAGLGLEGPADDAAPEAA